jgi:hypothetical protein
MFDAVREHPADDYIIGMMIVGQIAWGVVIALSLHAAFHVILGS